MDAIHRPVHEISSLLLDLSPIQEPAKMSGGLLDRIRRFGEKRGWFRPSDVILDIFGGIGTTGLMRLYGYDIILIELEAHFVRMAEDNARLLDSKGAWVKRLGKCRIVQGDSRKLTELLGVETDSSVLSPPYGDSRICKSGLQGGYHAKKDWDKDNSHRDYGQTEGQIGNLPDKSPNGAVLSPPYEQSLSNGLKPKHRERYEEWARAGRSIGEVYGEAEGQIGKEHDETYQSAMLVCYQELYKVLKPGGVACVVVKCPTRKNYKTGKSELRRLDVDTATLLLMAGFKLWCPACESWTDAIHDHPDGELEPIVGYRAVLMREVVQQTLFGEEKKRLRGRCSFF